MKPHQIAFSRPVDRQAAIVGFWPGEHWEPTLSEHQAYFAQPTPTTSRPVEPNAKYAHVTGLRRGQLTALCFHGVNRNGKPLWLMRCDCGRYTFRYIKGWIKRLGDPDRCAACETTQALTRPSPSRAAHGVRHARWIQQLVESGFTAQQAQLVDQYRLPCDDLVWLKGAVSEIETLMNSKGGAA